MKERASCVVRRASRRVVRAVFAAALAVSVAFSGWAADKTWVGGTSSFASEDANWQGGAKPESGDNIVMSGSVDMTWDLDDVTVGDWTQDGYTGTVTFMTGETGLTAKGVEQTVHGVLVGGRIDWLKPGLMIIIR